jgi:LAS superfamily LD-carboxypeptidase LdcB
LEEFKVKNYFTMFLLISSIFISCSSPEKIEQKSSITENKQNTSEQSVAEKVKQLESQFKPKYDEAIFQLESETTKRLTDVAKMPRSEGASTWKAEIAELQVERDKLSKKLNIEKSYVSDLLKSTDAPNVKDEIQKTKGRELEKMTLDTNKRLAEIDRQSKDLSIKIKTGQITRERDSKLSQLENEYKIKQAEIEYNASKESLERTKRAMNINK